MSPEAAFRKLTNRLIHLIGALAATEEFCKRGYPSVTVPGGVVGENGVVNGNPHTLVGNAQSLIEGAKSAAEVALVGMAQEAVRVTKEREVVTALERLQSTSRLLQKVAKKVSKLREVVQDADRKGGLWSLWSRKLSRARGRCRDASHAVHQAIDSCFQAWNRVRGSGFEELANLEHVEDEDEFHFDGDRKEAIELERPFRVAQS